MNYVDRSIVLSVLIVVSLSHGSVAQVPSAAKKESSVETSDVSPALIKWTSLLDQITVESKTLADEPRRPEALSYVADAYWEIAPDKSRKLFSEALDLALSIEKEKERQVAVNLVITKAAKRDQALAKTFTQVMVERKSRGLALRSSLALIDSDLSAAETIALTASQSGASFDSAWLIFQLHKHDPAAAARVYLAYLNNPNSHALNKLLWLAGYTFSYGETIGGGLDPVAFTGMSGFDFDSIPNRQFATSYLGIADQSFVATLSEASRAPDKAEELTGLTFFALSYLLPEAEKYRPDLFSRWAGLLNDVSSRLNVARRSEISAKLNSILADRERASKRKASELLPVEDPIEQQADKLGSTCQRDELFAKAALRYSHAADFKRASVLADKIDRLDLRASVLQFINYDASIASMNANSLSNLDEALRYANQVANFEQRILLYMKLAARVKNAGNEDQAKQLWFDAVKFGEKVDNRGARAATLVAITDGFPGSSCTDCVKLLKSAITAINGEQELKPDELLISRRVDFTCNGNNSWYGETLAGFNLVDSLIALGKGQESDAVELAMELNQGADRIKSLAALAQQATQKIVARESSKQKSQSPHRQ